MNTQEQIVELAKLDGWKPNAGQWYEVKGDTTFWFTCSNDDGRTGFLPDYRVSYDAIIPLIQKLYNDGGGCLWNDLFHVLKKIKTPCECGEHWAIWMLLFTPAQLAEALLQATGKWKDAE